MGKSKSKKRATPSTNAAGPKVRRVAGAGVSEPGPSAEVSEPGPSAEVSEPGPSA